MFTTNTAIILGVALGILCLLYWRALPKPIPGIPYNKEATGNLLGDIPNLMTDMKKRGDFFLWVQEQNLKSTSVLNQLFITPFGKPVVVVADHRESRDFLLHRSQDFDRSYLVRDLFRPLIGNGQITLATGPLWKKTRRIAQDTMTPKFLHGVVAPNIYDSSLRFVELWHMKSQLASERPFEAEKDFFHAALDGVLAFTFGSEYPYSATGPQLEGISAVSKADFDTGSDLDAPISFPSFGIGDELKGMTELVAVMDEVQKSGIPQVQWQFVKRTARFKRLQKVKNACIRREVLKAEERFKQMNGVSTEVSARNGVDLIVNRETIMATKENRAPDYFSEVMQAEIFGFIVGGHDTTSSTMCWASKLLADNQHSQSLLRQTLRLGFSVAVSETRQPTVQEIFSISIPYLDATIEELFRMGGVVPLNSRQTTRQTELLGRVVPKDTVVMFLATGPGTTMPSYRVDEKLRSETSQQDKKEGRFNDWSDDDIGMFKPERWLVGQPDSVKFDTNAGPSMPFGLGIRACFGRRLAYVSFRIFLVMMIWNFELLECPEAQSDYTGIFSVVYKPQRTFVRLRKVDHTAAAERPGTTRDSFQ